MKVGARALAAVVAARCAVEAGSVGAACVEFILQFDSSIKDGQIRESKQWCESGDRLTANQFCHSTLPTNRLSKLIYEIRFVIMSNLAPVAELIRCSSPAYLSQ